MDKISAIRRALVEAGLPSSGVGAAHADDASHTHFAADDGRVYKVDWSQGITPEQIDAAKDVVADVLGVGVRVSRPLPAPAPVVEQPVAETEQPKPEKAKRKAAVKPALKAAPTPKAKPAKAAPRGKK